MISSQLNLSTVMVCPEGMSTGLDSSTTFPRHSAALMTKLGSETWHQFNPARGDLPGMMPGARAIRVARRFKYISKELLGLNGFYLRA